MYWRKKQSQTRPLPSWVWSITSSQQSPKSSMQWIPSWGVWGLTSTGWPGRNFWKVRNSCYSLDICFKLSVLAHLAKDLCPSRFKTSFQIGVIKTFISFSRSLLQCLFATVGLFRKSLLQTDRHSLADLIYILVSGRGQGLRVGRFAPVHTSEAWVPGKWNTLCLVVSVSWLIVWVFFQAYLRKYMMKFLS